MTMIQPSPCLKAQKGVAIHALECLPEILADSEIETVIEDQRVEQSFV